VEINDWPRHQLRAQGRLRYDPRAGYRQVGSTESAVHADSRTGRTDCKDTATRAAQLLNFLSRTAAHAERNILQNASVPDFALIKNSIKPEFDINDLVAWKRQNMVPDIGITNITIAREEAAEGLLGRLASTIAEHAAVITPGTDEHDYEHDFAIVTGTDVKPIHDSALELNDWFNCLFDTADGESEYPTDFKSAFSRIDSALLPAALPPYMPSFDADTSGESHSQINFLRTEPAKISALRQRFGKTRRERSRLFRRLVIDQPRIASLPDGERVERFDNGAELKKDALGRVRHIRSGLGVSIVIAYDHEGQPQGFVRSDRHGQMHSIGERDRHGVVVRDIEGRVRAAGESMSVDPSGCLSVRRFDGQFWSLDLVKELHIERRSIVGRDGAWNFLTAVFASDGFRMMTRFQSLQDEDGLAGDRFHWLAAEPSGTFRFYGRDGSVIEFEGEDHLTDVKPQQVWAPGSRAIDSDFRGHHQAGTAWDSVQEYVTSYLSS
jgi:hypothetical protein